MTDFIQVTTSVSQRTDAERIAQKLVGRRLAACVQVLGPIVSTYRWQRRVETAEEWLCIAKTSGDRYLELEKAIRELHTYELPEILATPVIAGNADYLAWLQRSLDNE